MGRERGSGLGGLGGGWGKLREMGVGGALGLVQGGDRWLRDEV